MRWMLLIVIALAAACGGSDCSPEEVCRGAVGMGQGTPFLPGEVWNYCVCPSGARYYYQPTDAENVCLDRV